MKKRQGSRFIHMQQIKTTGINNMQKEKEVSKRNRPETENAACQPEI